VRCFRALVLLALLAESQSLGAARARDGGTLAIAQVGGVEADRQGETPEGSTLRQLLAAPLCRLAEDRRVEPLLATFERVPGGLVVRPLPGARFASGEPLGVAEIVRAWQRALTLSPVARAALAPLGSQRASALEQQARGPGPLLLALAYPWPDLEATLCHPALAPELEGGRGVDGVGPYQPESAERARASPGFPGGRPHPDALALSILPRRAALRALQQRSIQAVLGEPGDAPGPALFATYLVHPADSPLRGVVAARLDRAALVRSFVGAHAVPMPGLLPPVLGGPEKPSSVPGSAPRGSGRAVLAYARGRTAQRAVAERLQILLRDAGVQLTLSPLEPEALDQALRTGQADLALRSVLLPPLPAPALAVVLDLAEATGSELATLGAVPDPEARAAAARTRALQLADSVHLLPLFAESARVRVDPGLVDVRRDGFGVWILDDAWWP